MEQLVALGICVLLPIVIVWLTSRVRINAQNKRTQVLMEAIKMNPSMDVDKLVESLAKPVRSPREINNRRLLAGLLCLLIGIVLYIVCGVEYSMGHDSDIIEFITFGGILVAAGIAYLVVYFTNRKHISDK